VSYISHVLATRPANLLAYWPLNETAGSIADNAEGTAVRDGTYTNIDLNQVAGPDGQPAGYWDGSNDYVDIYSASLAGVWDGDLYTISLWIKVDSSSVWTDSTLRHFCNFYANGNNLTFIRKNPTNNQVEFYRIGGGAGGTQVLLNSVSDTGWLHFVITADQASNEFKAYYNGSQTGTTQTGLNSWAASLDSSGTVIGAELTIPSAVWNGYIAHAAVWDVALTDSEIAQLYIASTYSDTQDSSSTEASGITTTTTTYLRIYTNTNYETVVVMG